MRNFIFLPILSFFVVQAAFADMNPIEVTGYNQDVIVEPTATDAASATSIGMDGAGNVIFDTGFLGDGGGLASHTFSSLYSVSGPTTFTIAPSTGLNALYLQTNTTQVGTLNLVNPISYNKISVLGLATDANTAATGRITTVNVNLNFSDGTNQLVILNLNDWFSNQVSLPVAIQGFDRVSRNTNLIESLALNPKMFQYDITIDPLNVSKTLVSLDFENAPQSVLKNQSAIIFAVSGDPFVAVPEPGTMTTLVGLGVLSLLKRYKARG